MQKEHETELFWFVLKTIFKRELKIKALLDEKNIENFIPMCYKIKKIRGKKEKILVPAINDLVFVHTDKETMEIFKQEVLTKFSYNTYFLTRKEGLKRVIETVHEKQMQEFIKVSSCFEEEISFYKPEEIELKKGMKVRVIGGVFDGVEGILMRCKNRKEKRIVLQIPSLAVATSHISPDLIEIIK